MSGQFTDDSGTCPAINPPIHLWLACCREWDPASLEASLSRQERERAARFHRPVDRDRYVVRRGVLRRLLGRYVGVDPGDVPIGVGRHGKPILCMDSPIRFNVSGCGDLALYAIGCDGEVGVDLEYIDPAIDFQPIAARCFSAAELVLLHSLPSQQAREAFYSLWTCKEACVKCTGEGMSAGLDQIEVTLDLSSPRASARSGTTHWSLLRMIPAPGYVAALAVCGVGEINWYSFLISHRWGTDLHR